MNEKKNNAPERSFSLVQAGFWMSFCVSVSFAAVYLQALDYSNARLGVILALGNVMGIIVSTALSSMIDEYERLTAKRLIPWILALQTLSVLVLILINLVRDVGGNTADLGFITAFKGIVEIPIMFLYAKFFKDGKHALALRISVVAFVLKTLAFIASGSEWQLMASFILQMPSYVLYMSAVVYYVNENINFKDSAKAQSLAFTTTTFGGMLASLIGGQLYDSLPVKTTLWIAFAVGALGAVIMFIGTRKRK